MKNLNEIAKVLRRDIFKTAFVSKTGHIAPAFSCIDIMTALYFGDILKYDANDPYNEDRDRFILSKGHACLSLYVCLAKAGFVDSESLKTYCTIGENHFGGHPVMGDTPGIEATTGSLGHGLAFAVGIALTAKLDNKDNHTYVLLGDGECQEGSIWESALFASSRDLNNLTAIVDYNKLQAMDRLENIVDMGDFEKKWETFGWHVVRINGHNFDEILDAFKNHHSLKPKVIIADTIKGKGVSFMENVPLWHIRFPNDDELEILLNELDFTKEELYSQ